MNIKNLAYYQKQLLSLQKRLRNDVVQMAGEALDDHPAAVNSEPTHRTESGIVTFDQEFTLRLVRNEDGLLDQISDALTRIKKGVYGVCAECKTKIPKARLHAIPYAIHCVQCASQLQSPKVHLPR